MFKSGSAVSNGLWNALSRLALGAVQILGSILIVRGLNQIDANAYGTFSYYATIAGLLNTLGVLAFPNALTKIASELRGNGATGEAQALARSLAIGLLALNALISLAIGAWALLTPPPVRWYLLIVALTPLFHVLTRVLSSLLWGYETYRPISLATTIGGFLQLGLIVASFVYDWGITGYLVAVVLSINVLIPIVLALFYLPQLPGMARAPKAWPSRDTVGRYFAFATPATLVVFFDAIIWQRSEVLFLERLSTPAEIGYYSLAFSVLLILLGLGLALINGYYPAISREFGAGNWDAIRRKIRQAFQLAVTFGMPFLFGGLATLHLLIPLVYGEAMRPAVPVVHILFIGLVPAVVAGVLGLSIAALGRMWVQVRLGVSLAVLNIVLDLLLIPSLDAVGAAVANTTTQVSYVVWLYVIVMRISGARFPWVATARITLLALVSAGLLPFVLIAVVPAPFGLVLAIPLAAALYVVLLDVTGSLDAIGIRLPARLPRLRRRPTPPAP